MGISASTPLIPSSVTDLLCDLGKVIYLLCASVSPLCTIRNIITLTSFLEILCDCINDCYMFWDSWWEGVLETQNIALSWHVCMSLSCAEENQNCSPVCHRHSTVHRYGRFNWSPSNWQWCLRNRVKQSWWQSRSMECLVTTLCPWGTNISL